MTRVICAAAKVSILVLFCSCATGNHNPVQRKTDRSSTAPGITTTATSSDAHSENSRYGAPRLLARLTNRSVNESSGIVASHQNPGVFWTHNDSGDGPFLYAFDREGQSRGVWRVLGAQATDWEDIARGPGPLPDRSYLYIGDIGDNDREREEIIIYRVPEPVIGEADSSSTKMKPRLTDAAETIRLRYPDGRHDAEALLVHPQTADIYILTKTRGNSSTVYKTSALRTSLATVTLEQIAQVRLPSVFGGLLTGGDISADGRGVVLCDYIAAYEFRLPAESEKFGEVWAQQPSVILLGESRQWEAICYGADGKSILLTSEGSPAPLFQIQINEQWKVRKEN